MRDAIKFGLKPNNKYNLTPEQIAEIRADFKAGKTVTIGRTVYKSADELPTDHPGRPDAESKGAKSVDKSVLPVT